MSKKLDLKQISANFLLVCGMISALCATFVQVKDTFFPEEEPVIEEVIQEAPIDSKAGDTPDVQAQQYVTMSAPPETSGHGYTWIIILVVSLAAVGGGIILRKKIVKEVKEIK
jgi:hypothetical protein